MQVRRTRLLLTLEKTGLLDFLPDSPTRHVRHEIVHAATSQIHSGGSAFFEEGFAVDLTGEGLTFPVTYPRSNLGLRSIDVSHRTAGHFMRWLRSRYTASELKTMLRHSEQQRSASHAKAAFAKATGDDFLDVEQIYFDTAPEFFAPFDVVAPSTVPPENGGWDIILDFDCEQMDTEGYNDRMWRRVRINVTASGRYVLMVTSPATAFISLRRTEHVNAGEPIPDRPSWPIGDDLFDPPEAWLPGLPHETWLDVGIYDIEVHVSGVAPTAAAVRIQPQLGIGSGETLMHQEPRMWLVALTLAFACREEGEPERFAVVEGGICSSQSDPQCNDPDSMLMCIDREWTEIDCAEFCAFTGLGPSGQGCVADSWPSQCACETTPDSCAGMTVVCVSEEAIEGCIDGELGIVECADVCANLDPPRTSLGCDNAGWSADCRCTLEGSTCEATEPARCDDVATLGARGAMPRATSLGLFAEGFVAKTCSTPGTAAFWLRALDENSGARSRDALHHGLLASCIDGAWAIEWCDDRCSPEELGYCNTSLTDGQVVAVCTCG